MSDSISLLADAVLLKHRHAVLIRNLPVLNPSLILVTGSLIATNIGDLVPDQRAARIEEEALHKHKEDKGVHMLLRAAYGDLLNLSWRSDLTIWMVTLWPPLPHAPKYR